MILKINFNNNCKKKYIYKLKMDSSNYFIILIIILIQIKLSLNSCEDRAKPIFVKTSNSCEMKYCTKEDFEQKICIKDNEIIRVQWLTNIIKFKTKNCKNPKIVKYQNGNIGIFTGEKSNSMLILIIDFYFLNEYGKFSIFQIKNTDSAKSASMVGGAGGFIINPNVQAAITFDDGDSLVIKDSNNEELIFNIGKQFENTELYDIQNENVYSNKTRYFFDNQIFTNIRGSFI